MLFKPGALKTEKKLEEPIETNAPKGGGLFKRALDTVKGTIGGSGDTKTDTKKDEQTSTNESKGGFLNKAIDYVKTAGASALEAVKNSSAGDILKYGAQAASALPIPYAGAISSALNSVGNMISNKPGALKQAKDGALKSSDSSSSSSSSKGSNLDSYLSQAYIPVVVPVPYNSFKK